MNNFGEKVNFIWKIAELLRGPYKPEKYGDVILPLSVLRRFDCLLEPTKEAVIEKAKTNDIEMILNRTAGHGFSNKSQYDFNRLLDDPDNIRANFESYLRGFSSNIREIIENFEFEKEIKKLDDNNLLFLTIKEFTQIDLHPEVVSNQEMGYIFEELIRRFSENAEAGDHYTPREVIELMVNLIFNGVEDELTTPGSIFTVGDFACGTGGMLSVATNYIKKLNPTAQVEVFGQELNPQSYAICRADILIKGQQEKNIVFGNSFTRDGHRNQKVRFALMNPPFGVDWKKDKEFIDREVNELGFNGRFGAGTPRTSDGSLLFLQHMTSKMIDDEKGSRMAIIFNGSPLFTGDAGSGESEIRRWIIENDLLEGIIALPNDLFYNTGIATYIWVLANRKNENILNGPVRKGKVQLVDGSGFYHKMRKSLGSKRNEISEADINEIARLYGDFKENEYCKIFDNKEFGYLKVTVERPLRLNFQISEERIENLYAEAAFSKLYDQDKVDELELKKEKRTIKKKEENELSKQYKGKVIQDNIIDILRANISDELIKNRDAFEGKLKNMLKGLDVSNTLHKAILMSLSKRDETADYCMKGKKKEADSNLRDTETIPLSIDVNGYTSEIDKHIKKEKNNILAYIEKEVKPHVSEFWIDESKTKIGYEIPFTRYFYKYEELRPFKDIMAEIVELEKEIQSEIKKVIG
jgi:type I restriction enzyme M protein